MFGKDQAFGFFDYEQLTKDFCYNKPLSFHFRTTNPNTMFELEELVEVKSGRCWLTERAEITRKIGNKTLQATLATGSIKLYYAQQLQKQLKQQEQQQQIDKEIIKENAESTVLYSRLFTDRKLQNASLQLGIFKSIGRLTADANLSAFLYQRQNQYFLYGRLLYKGGIINVGVTSLFDYGCRNLQTNNVVVEFKPHKKHQFFARGEVDGLRNYSLKYLKLDSYFDYLILNYIARPTSTLALMAEYKYDFNAKRTKTIQSIVQKKFPRNTLKFGVNQLADITFQMSFPLNLGNASKLDFGIQVADILKGRKISYGFKVDISA